MAVGEPLAPLEVSLRNVALILAGVSTGFWLLAAAVGRRLCNRAIFPMTRMAKAACVMTAADRDHRLPSPGTGDELDALAGSFNGLLDRLHQEYERQKRFTGDASHQLRTPLTALLGQIEVAHRRHRTTDEYERVLDEVHGEAIRLRQIVESLLFMAGVETEAERLDLQPLDLVSWVHEHLREWSNHERAADLREDLPNDGSVYVRVHPHLLGQLLDNLLDNACKYSSAGTPIRVCVRREDNVAALAVQDRGWGLASDDRLHVFEPFFRSADAPAGDSPALALVSPSFSGSPTSSVARSTLRASLDEAAASCFVSRSLKPRYRRSINLSQAEPLSRLGLAERCTRTPAPAVDRPVPSLYCSESQIPIESVMRFSKTDSCHAVRR